MKTKTILLIIFTLLVIAFAGWLFLRESDAPIAETIRDGLPFGSGDDINIPATAPEDTVGQTTPFDENITAENELFRLSNTPVAGFVIFERPSTNSGQVDTVVRYADRATGHIFDAVMPTASSSLERQRITNQTLPKIYEAHFNSSGSEVLFRSLDDNNSDLVKNITLSLTPPQTNSTSTTQLHSVSLTNLRGDIDSPLPATGNTIFYVLKETNSIAASSWTGSNLRTLFESAFDNWRLARAGNNLLVYTKASVNAPGFAYTLNSGGGSLNKILGPLNGLTVVANSNNSRVLYSYYDGGTRLFVRNQASGQSSEILPATIAEKCVWSEEETNVFFCGTPVTGIAAGEPDNWYLGRTHYSDYLWRFDVESEIAQLVSDPKTNFDIDVDISNPTLSEESDYLVFVNKRDLTLWAIKLQ